jgi:hypothetical protein
MVSRRTERRTEVMYGLHHTGIRYQRNSLPLKKEHGSGAAVQSLHKYQAHRATADAARVATHMDCATRRDSR